MGRHSTGGWSWGRQWSGTRGWTADKEILRMGSNSAVPGYGPYNTHAQYKCLKYMLVNEGMHACSHERSHSRPYHPAAKCGTLQCVSVQCLQCFRMYRFMFSVGDPPALSSSTAATISRIRTASHIFRHRSYVKGNQINQTQSIADVHVFSCIAAVGHSVPRTGYSMCVIIQSS